LERSGGFSRVADGDGFNKSNHWLWVIEKGKKGNRDIGKKENRWIWKKGNRGIGEYGKRGIGEYGVLELLAWLCVGRNALRLARTGFSRSSSIVNKIGFLLYAIDGRCHIRIRIIVLLIFFYLYLTSFNDTILHFEHFLIILLFHHLHFDNPPVNFNLFHLIIMYQLFLLCFIIFQVILNCHNNKEEFLKLIILIFHFSF
jgi:hypothetical protein